MSGGEAWRPSTPWFSAAFIFMLAAEANAHDFCGPGNYLGTKVNRHECVQGRWNEEKDQAEFVNLCGERVFFRWCYLDGGPWSCNADRDPTQSGDVAPGGTISPGGTSRRPIHYYAYTCEPAAEAGAQGCIDHSSWRTVTGAEVRVYNGCSSTLNVNICLTFQGAPFPENRNSHPMVPGSSWLFSFADFENRPYNYRIRTCRPGSVVRSDTCPARCP